MADDIIPDDVARLILERIDSVAQLEALLLLRNNPDTEWSAQSLAARLYISEEQTMTVLLSLRSRGFAVSNPADPSLYRYRPSSPDLKGMLDRLADIYAKHLVPVTNLIHSKPKSRIQEFADAFRLRKDK